MTSTQFLFPPSVILFPTIRMADTGIWLGTDIQGGALWVSRAAQNLSLKKTFWPRCNAQTNPQVTGSLFLQWGPDGGHCFRRKGFLAPLSWGSAPAFHMKIAPWGATIWLSWLTGHAPLKLIRLTGNRKHASYYKVKRADMMSLSFWIGVLDRAPGKSPDSPCLWLQTHWLFWLSLSTCLLLQSSPLGTTLKENGHMMPT